MQQTHSRRIAAIQGHLSPYEQAQKCVLSLEDCAATQNVSFGRQQETDAFFARPAKHLLSRDQRVYTSALRYGEGTLRAVRAEKASSDQVQNLPVTEGRSTEKISDVLPTEFDSVKGWHPQVHTISKPHEDVFIFVLPGVKKGQLRVEYNGCKVFITGVRVEGFSMSARPSEDTPLQKSSTKLPLGDSKRTGVREGEFALEWTLPDYGFTPKLSARFSNSRLRLAVAKVQQKLPELALRSRHNAGM